MNVMYEHFVSIDPTDTRIGSTGFFSEYSTWQKFSLNMCVEKLLALETLLPVSWLFYCAKLKQHQRKLSFKNGGLVLDIF